MSKVFKIIAVMSAMTIFVCSNQMKDTADLSGIAFPDLPSKELFKSRSGNADSLTFIDPASNTVHEEEKRRKKTRKNNRRKNSRTTKNPRRKRRNNRKPKNKNPRSRKSKKPKSRTKHRTPRPSYNVRHSYDFSYLGCYDNSYII